MTDDERNAIVLDAWRTATDGMDERESHLWLEAWMAEFLLPRLNELVRAGSYGEDERDKEDHG